MKKKIPTFRTNEDAENFFSKEDLSVYDLSGAKPVQFEFKPKDRSINIRLSDDLLAAVRQKAEREGIPYQRFIRQALERAVSQGN
ncbi:MAG: ribbon-helix-helix protein, CopG family [Chlorobiaceae bacterium]|jgi:predicted DNA binding CopG/RHH family protein|nr:ribbon-helix-helix protein, CopG family [Chlorobiaceae bacterium]